MDTEQMDTIDIGVEELSRSFNYCVSLANPFVPVAEQEVSQNIANCRQKEPKDGDCYIFNYQEFEKTTKMSPRKGSEKDAARLKHDFMQLNFDVHMHVNLSYEKTLRVLKEASSKDYSMRKYFICCFLTHGGKNGGLRTKDKKMYIDDILVLFSDSSSLKGIPKIFIIEACRGEEPELGVSADSTDSCFSTNTEDYLDFLIVNSAYEDTVSFRSSNAEEVKCHGSFFIDELCRSLEEFSDSLDLLQVLTIVNYRMSKFLSHCKHKDEGHETRDTRNDKELDLKKQMPCFYSTIRNKVEFNKNIKPCVNEDTKWFDRRRKRHGFAHGSANNPQSNSYNIKKAERVLCLSIINENIGKGDSWVRSAIRSIRTCFGNYSHKTFQDDFKKSKIRKFLNENNKSVTNESKAKQSSDVDCLICYIAAYSRYDYVCDASGRKIAKKEIIEKFIGQQNKSFVGKPKIFIFLLRKLSEEETLPHERFCENTEHTTASGISMDTKGRRFHFGTDSVDGELYSSINSTERESNVNTESTDGGYVGENLIPNHADILEICITITDWEQAIDTMELFQEILGRKEFPKEDLLSLFTEFNFKLVEKHDFFQESKKSFSMTSTLTKTLFLP